jgi:single-strand DNA-binding protein
MFGELTILGRLGADPEMKYTPSGKAVTELRVAVDQGYGENKSTLWVTVTCWGGQDGKGGMAEAAANYLSKGSGVFVKGEPKVRAYVANNGEARAVLELTARELKFLDGKKNGEQAHAPADAPRAAQSTTPAAPQYQQISPDGKFGWNGTAWVAIPQTTTTPPPPPAAAIPPPPAAPQDVNPDEIPFK